MIPGPRSNGRRGLRDQSTGEETGAPPSQKTTGWPCLAASLAPQVQRSRPRRCAYVAALGLVLSICALPATVHAAACCSSATVGGVGRLLIWERAATGLSLTFAKGRGFWDTDGEWHRHSGTEDELRLQAWALLRTSMRGSAFISGPYVFNHRTAGELDERGHGVGDVSAGYRHEFIQIGEFVRVPGVALSLTALAPTGRTLSQAQSPLGSDVTGRGAWSASADVGLEWTKYPGFFRIDFGGSYHFATSDGHSQRFGPGGRLSITGGAEVIPDLSIGATLSATAEAAIHRDGDPVENSGKHLLEASLGISWRAHPHWTFQLGAGSGLFANRLGDNERGSVRFSGGLRYGFF